MKKLFIWALMATMCVAVPEMVQAQKTVTYTFKGSVLDNSAILSSVFGRKQQLYLKSSGAKPAGVQDPDINCTTAGHTPPVGNSHDGGDFQHYDKHLLGGLSTLYVVEENEHAVVRFHNFKYEVSNITWRRRSQHALMTSKGGSWLEDFQGNEAGSFVEYGDEDGLEKDYSTNGEIFYHTRDFVVPDKKYIGLSTLNVQVTSKRSYQGIAVQDFVISYYVPEPLITHTDNGDGTYTVDVTIGEAQHVGAFTKNDFSLDYNSNQLDMVSSDVTVVGGTTIHGVYTLRPKADAKGTAVVYAKIMNNGEVAGKSSTSIKLQLSPKKGFSWEGEKFWEKSSSRWNDDKTWSSATNCTTLTLATTAGYLNGTNTVSKSTTLIEMNGDKRNMAREGVIAVSYTLDVPAYTEVTRKMQFQVTFNKSLEGGAVFWGELANAEIRAFDKPSGVEEYEIADILNGKTFKSNSIDEATFANSGSVLLYNSLDGNDTATPTTGNATYPHYFWKMTNTSDERGVADDALTYNVSKPFVKYFTLAGDDMSSNTGYKTTKPKWTFEYIPFTGTSDYDFVYDYYAYITYDLDGGTGLSTTGPTIHKTKSQNNTDAANGGIPAKILPLTDSDLDASCNLTYSGLTKTTTDAGRTINWKFLGWKDATDGEYYYPGDKFNPFDKSGECGKGPRTLVAQWEEIPAIIGVTFLADGGKVGGTSENYVSKRVTYNHTGWYIDDSHDESGFGAPTASKTGYDFLGYTDMTGLQEFNDAVAGGTDASTAAATYGIYNASGVLQTGKATNYITSSKWTSIDNAVFYAMFKQKPAGEIASIKHTLTLNANYAGAPSPEVLNMMTGSQDYNNLVLHTPTRPVEPANASTIDHYMFAGWYTDPSAGNMVYAADGSAVKLVSVTPANLDVFPPIPEKSLYEAYNSTYWNNDATYKYTSDATLYAHWVAVPKTGDLIITFKEGTNSVDNSAKWDFGGEESMENRTYEAVEYDVVNVVRTLKPGHWNTVCFPCDIYKKQCGLLFDQIKVLTSIEIEEETVIMKFSDSPSITAGVPYFVHMLENPNESDTEEAYYNTSTNTLTLKGVETGKTTSSSIGTSGQNWVKMYGNFVTTHLEDGLIYLQNDLFYVSGKEYSVGGENKIVKGHLRGFRCYFEQHLDDGGGTKLRTFHLDLEGFDGWSGETLIQNLLEEADADDAPIFDLSGRKLSAEPRKGFYIKGGKKYFVK